MINKDYKRLTNRYDEPMSHVEQYTDRLCYLEDCIENGTLVFLPCKVGDEFWWLLQLYDGSYMITSEKIQAIEITERGVSIIDITGEEWYLSEVYFTKEAAKKALEEFVECKPLQ